MVNASRRTHWPARLAALALTSYSALAAAQSSASVAEGLFREGRALMTQGDYAAACSKLAESQRLDPSAGTLLNLGACQEKQGKVASAWATFLAAQRLARTQNRTNIMEEAAQRASELEPKVSYLKVVLAARVPGIRVKIDDVELESAALDSKIPVDPGERTVVVVAPGHKSVEMKVSVGAERDTQTLNVPKLESEDSTSAGPGASAPEPAGPARPAHTGPRAEEATHRGSPVLAYVVGGVGLAALGVGTAFAFMAKSSYDDAESQCPTRTGCSSAALDQRDKAETRANIANVGIGLGVAGVGVAAVLLLTQPSEPPRRESGFRSVRVSPFVSRGSAGLSLTGATF